MNPVVKITPVNIAQVATDEPRYCSHFLFYCFPKLLFSKEFFQKKASFLKGAFFYHKYNLQLSGNLKRLTSLKTSK